MLLLNDVNLNKFKAEKLKNETMYSNLRLLLHYKKYMQCFQVLNPSLTVFSKIVNCNYIFTLNMFYFYPPPPPPPPPKKKKNIYIWPGEISILILLLELPPHVIKPLNFIRHRRVYNVGFKQI